MNTLNISFPLERSEVVSMLQHYKISPTRQRVEIAEFLLHLPGWVTINLAQIFQS